VFLVALPTAASSDNPEDQQKYHGPDGGGGNRVHNPGANTDAQPGQQPRADEGADNPDDDVANDPEAGSLHELSGEPACNETYDQNDDKTFIGNGHDISLLPSRTRRLGWTIVPARVELRKASRSSGHNTDEPSLGFWVLRAW
jgi:hypothetical protein